MSENLQVVIVGAGLAGLAAAIALRSPNHDITILESSRLKSEVGAAIQYAKRELEIESADGFRIAWHPTLRRS